MDYFDKAETWDRATLETVQLARLKTTIQQASRAPFYAKRLAEAGVSADNLRSLEDIRRIPFTTQRTISAPSIRMGSPRFRIPNSCVCTAPAAPPAPR